MFGILKPLETGWNTVAWVSKPRKPTYVGLTVNPRTVLSVPRITLNTHTATTCTVALVRFSCSVTVVGSSCLTMAIPFSTFPKTS